MTKLQEAQKAYDEARKENAVAQAEFKQITQWFDSAPAAIKTLQAQTAGIVAGEMLQGADTSLLDKHLNEISRMQVKLAAETFVLKAMEPARNKAMRRTERAVEEVEALTPKPSILDKRDHQEDYSIKYTGKPAKPVLYRDLPPNER